MPLLGEWDTVIVGGGPASANAGNQQHAGRLLPLIVDKNIRLGGTAVNALITPDDEKSFTGHHTNFFDIERKRRLGHATRDELAFEMLWFTLR